MIIDNGNSMNPTASFVGNPRRKAFADITNANQGISSKSNNLKGKSAFILPTKREPTIRNVFGIQEPSNNTHAIATGSSCIPSDINVPTKASGVFLGQSSSLQLGVPRYQQSRRVTDIDERDKDDELAVSEYAADIYSHFKVQERTMTHVPPHFMAMQPQITEEMRGVLVDWLVTLQFSFRLGSETLYLAVNLTDRYCSVNEVPRSTLQLVGATALFIASKYEEVSRALWVNDLVAICDNLYCRQEFVKMETQILSALGFKISAPTAFSFLPRYLKAGHADQNLAQLAAYVLEETLLSYPLLTYLPSQLAAASVLIARNATGRKPWSPTLLKYAEYREEQVVPVARAILKEKDHLPGITSVYKKYSSRRFGRVAEIDVSLSEIIGAW
ncbi:B-type cyclin [Seminavis robusta]|uniref:B-type cyclin n=1 Tax=Seminavis robusta TaxID=568900 RepID=A0A9N8HJQ3_9STRA|nr:B-type cyclin [Seminavis robusta]|eukprot:Sro781_g201590.1 B-type cyclin (387) ;mRNA; r:30293-31541